MSRLMVVEIPSYSCEFKGIREVRELICCRECKYWVNGEDYDCEKRLSAWKPDDFCSYGVKKGAEDE